jgi:signal peptidase I
MDEAGKDKKAEPIKEAKKSLRGIIWMAIWLLSVVVFVLWSRGIIASGLALLSVPVGVISIIAWAIVSKIGRIVLAIIILLFMVWIIVYFFIARPHKVADNSMSPALSQGDCVWFEKVSYYFNPPKRDDIILFTANDNITESYGRIIGLPGEEILIKPGEITVNGNKLNEKHINWGGFINMGSSLQPTQIKLGENQYLAMDDNQGGPQLNNASESENLTISQDVWNKFINDSIIEKGRIEGKASPIKYSCK